MTTFLRSQADRTMLTASEVASVLHISARKVYELAASGQLASHRFGSAVRFEPADIEAYKQSCRSPATTRAAGSTSSTVKFQGLEESALTSYFRKAGRAPKQKPTTSTRQRADTPLKLAYSENNT